MNQLHEGQEACANPSIIHKVAAFRWARGRVTLTKHFQNLHYTDKALGYSSLFQQIITVRMDLYKHMHQSTHVRRCFHFIMYNYNKYHACTQHNTSMLNIFWNYLFFAWVINWLPSRYFHACSLASTPLCFQWRTTWPVIPSSPNICICTSLQILKGNNLLQN